VSDFMPHTAAIADELCFIKSMHTDAVNHAPGISFLLSGAQIPGRPTLGAWLNYGLGSTRGPARLRGDDVGQQGHHLRPDFLRLLLGLRFPADPLPGREISRQRRAGALPRQSRRHEPQNSGAACSTTSPSLNEAKSARHGDPEIATRIAQYEMAFRMQTSVPDLTDFSDEPESVLDMYGPQVREPGTFAYNCLMARRLAERGVRFHPVMHAGWDQHNSLTTELVHPVPRHRPAERRPRRATSKCAACSTTPS
jgi:hypothetical protein